jgi:hypothetical protein
MSERERWIVYPLLLFALGAAIRDKLMQRVEAKEIRCESLQIVDQQDPNATLAELTFRRPTNSDPTQLSDAWGELRIINSDGKPMCEIGTDVIAGRIVARQLLVIDQQSKPTVVVTSEPQPALSLGQGEAGISYQGVIYLNNQPLGIRLAPPTTPALPAKQPPAANQAPTDGPTTETPPLNDEQ